MPGDPTPERSGKSTRLAEMLEEVIANGDHALIFSQYRQMGHLLVSMIRHEFNVDPLFLHGGTPQARRDQLVDRFQAKDAATPIFILSLKAGGVGLEPHRGESRVPLRPLVEPRGREPGHRPGLPNRAGPDRQREQDDLGRHARGTRRSDDRTENRTRRTNHRCRRIMGHGTVHREASATCSPCDTPNLEEAAER